MKRWGNCKSFLLGIGLVALAFPTAAQEGRWLGFVPYPGARHVCEKWVTGSSGGHRVEIHWHSFATHDEQAQVAAFYARKDKAQGEKDDDGSITIRHGENHVMSIFATSTHFPTCDRKEEVHADEKTVIWVSERVR